MRGPRQQSGADGERCTRRDALRHGGIAIAAVVALPSLHACGSDEPEETTRAPAGETATAPVTTLEPMATPVATPAATPQASPGATPVDEAAGESHLVEMNDDLRFVPERLTLQAGDTVVWRTVGSAPHTSTCDPDLAENPEEHVQLPDGAEPWDSGTVSEGEEYERTFDVTGEYTYFCIPHEAAGMIGYLTVEE